MERRGGLHDSGCVCAGGQGPSGASSSSPAARQHSSCSSAAAAPGPQSTDAPRHFLVSPERSGREKKHDNMIEERNKKRLEERVKAFTANVNRNVKGTQYAIQRSWFLNL